MTAAGTTRKKELEQVRLQIESCKRQIDATLLKNYSAGANQDDLWELRRTVAGLSLENCRAIASYVKRVSVSAGNELEMRRREVEKDLRKLDRSRDQRLLERWYKEELAPLLNKSEQAAYLVATTRKSEAGEKGTFRWRLQEPPGGEEHVKRFGTTADDFRYLNQTCPTCGNRIDAAGWCSCGIMGGG